MDGVFLSPAELPALAERPRRLRAGLLAAGLLVAGLLHVTALVALSLIMSPRHSPAPPAPASVTMVFAPLAPATPDEAQQVLGEKKLPVGAVDLPAVLAPLPSMKLPADKHPMMPRMRPRPAKRPAATDPGFMPQAEAPSPPARRAMPALNKPVTKPQQAEATAAVAAAALSLGAWELRVRQAVQDAAIYPASARLQRRQGKVEVQFDYDKGEVGRAAVVHTSSMAALDQAALAAVTHAAMPAPPPDLGPQTRTMVVWVNFSLVTED